MGSQRGFRWRRSSFTSSGADCVEVSWAGAVRDSKHPGGPMIRADLRTLVSVIKAGQLDH